jgi:cardiolipin synthase
VATTKPTSAVLTVPNALSALRLLGVPVFFWLIVVAHRDGLALGILVVSAFTDWLDGYLARRLQQFSRLGELLDPLADRLYVVAALLALYLRDVLPLWVVVILFARDLAMFMLLVFLKKYGYTGVPVHFVGKAATMNLLYALPLVLMGTFDGSLGTIAHNVGWAFLLWGIGMYWYGAVLYYQQVWNMRIEIKS